MIQRSVSIIATILFMVLKAGTIEGPNDWHSRYGPPNGEIYTIRGGTILTVFYSGEGKTCKATVEPKTPMSYDGFEDLLQEIVPVGDRGKEINSIGLGRSFS